MTEVGPVEAWKAFAHRQGQPNLSRDRLEATHTWGGRQWEPTVGGAHQQHLFNPRQIPPSPAHHQTPEQFANDERTWWHGRITAAKPRSLTQGGSDEGFHAGTRRASEERLNHNIRRRGLAEGKAAHQFPLRLVGRTVNGPDAPFPDNDKHPELGGSSAGYFYENYSEDRGSVSVGVPQRKGFMATHAELVKGAMDHGEYVHPNIAWAAKRAQPYVYKRPQPSSIGQPHQQVAREALNQAPQEQEDEASYTTASGKQMVASRRRGGDTNAPKTWDYAEAKKP